MEKKYFFFILMFIQVGAFAQDKEQTKYQIQFKSGNYVPEQHFQLESSGKKGSRGARKINSNEYALIQFYNLPDKAAHEKIKAAGIELLEYIPNNAYLASVPSSVSAGQLSALDVRAFEAVKPEHKIDPDLLKPDLADWVEKESGKIDVVINAFSDFPLSGLTNNIASLGGQVLTTFPETSLVEVRIPQELLTRLAQLEGVSFIAPVSPPPVPLNHHGVTTSRANVPASGIPGSPQLKGQGITVAVADIFSGKIHADLQNRVSNYATYNSNDPHGDHTSGTVAGAGNLNPLYAGVAPKASIIYTDMVDNINNAEGYYANQQVRITSNSYRGSLNGGEYNYDSRMIDLQTSGGKFPDLLHIFAAANEGSNFRTVADSWSASKNALVVGALDHKNNLAYYSSRGPVKDGRIKPEVVAMGTNVNSIAPGNQYSSRSGTSMATPAVAGVAALLYERYKQLHNNANPDAALIKALISNTADDLGNPGPDYSYGFGQVNARRAVEVLEEGNWLEGFVNAGDSVTHTISVPSGTAKLKVMLYWKDKEPAVNSAVALVNDLDLKVKKRGTAYLPWVLNPAPGKENSHAVRGVDCLNNIEQVTVDKPSGTYSFTVNGSRLATGSQEYVVVYEVIEPEIVVTYPYAGASLVPGESVFIRWDHAVGGNFTVEYSADNGASWKQIASGIPANKNFVEWQVPAIVSGQLLVRVSNGTKRGQSVGVSSILGVPQGLAAGTSDSGEQLIRWNKVAGADTYEVFRLSPSDKEMQLMATVAATSLNLSNIPSGNYWFSVRARNKQGAVGRRAAAIDLKVETASQNQVPVAYAGSDKTLTLPDNSITLSGRAVDSDGRFIAYRWEKVSGPSVSMSRQNTANVNLSNLVNGVYVFRFSATDNDGAIGSDEMTLTVIGDAASNQAPTVDAGGDRTVMLPLESLSLTATASDADGSVEVYRWAKISGPAVGMENTGSATLVLTELQEGSYTFSISVTDNSGATATDQLNLLVEQAPSGNQAPTAHAGSDKVLYLPTNSLNLSGLAYDTDGRFVAFRWEKVSGPSVTMASQNTANVKLTNLVEGVYVFRFSATDNDGATGSDDMVLTVRAATQSTYTTAISEDESITAYPNTFQDYVNLEIKAAEYSLFEVTVFDLLGRSLYHRQLQVDPATGATLIHRIDLSNVDIEEGVYIIQVDDRSRNLKKIIRIVKAW